MLLYIYIYSEVFFSFFFFENYQSFIIREAIVARRKKVLGLCFLYSLGHLVLDTSYRKIRRAKLIAVLQRIGKQLDSAFSFLKKKKRTCLL